MKKPCFLFLFFFMLLGLSIHDYPVLYSQDPNDSLRYYHDIIVNPKNSGEISKSFAFFENAISKNLVAGDTISAVQNLRRVAIGQLELGFIYESELTAVRALKLLEGLQENNITTEAKQGLNNHLGRVYRILGLYDNALKHYDNALRFALNTIDSVPMMNNIANVYLYRKDYKLAVKGFQSVFEKSLQIQDSIKIARAMDNLGYARSKLDMPDALPKMLDALEIRKSKNDIPGIYTSHYHLSNYYSDRGNSKKALEYANMAYQVAKKLNSPSYIEHALSSLLDLNDDPNVSEYKKLKDSIAQAKQIQENKYASIKYNVEKEKEKTLMAELQNEKEKRYKTMYLFAFLISIMAIGFVVYIKNQQRNKERIIASQNTEARISKKVHDELANDVAGVMNFVDGNIDTPSETKNQLQNFLNDIYIRARDIATQTSGVDVKDFPKALKNLLAQYHPKGVNIVTNSMTTIDWSLIANHKKEAIYKCLQELLVNTKKHAQATQISIVFKKVGKNNEIIYTDDGIGFRPDKVFINGLANVETRMTEIGGSFSFESDEGKGFKAKLIL